MLDESTELSRANNTASCYLSRPRYFFRNFSENKLSCTGGILLSKCS